MHERFGENLGLLPQVTAERHNYAGQENPALRMNEIFDAYEADLRRRKVASAAAIIDHLKPLRAAWGDMLFIEWSLGSKKRVRDEMERRATGDETHTPWSQGTQCKRVAHLRAALRFAFEEEMIYRIPPFKMPAKGAPRERVLSMEEIQRLLKAADHPITQPHTRLNIHMALGTGQRQSALHALKWGNVDFENRVLRFRDTQAAHERSKKKRTDMPMGDRLYQLLVEAKANAETDFVLERFGKKVGTSYASVKACMARAGIRDAHLHDLRRTAATLLLRATKDMKQVAAFVGDIESTTARHYAHSNAEDRRESVNTLSSVLYDAPPKAG